MSRTRPTVRHTISDSLVMTQRDLTATIRRPMLLVFVFIQPVILVLLFRYVLGGAIQTSAGDYADFLMPGILVMSAVFGALLTGIGLSEDLSKGMVDRLRSLPMARSSLLVGRTLSDVVRNVWTLALIIAVGLLIGFSPTEPVPRLLAAFVLLLLFSYAFSWITATIGLSFPDPETAQSAGMIWVFPLTFASSAFVPTDTMPAAVEAFADINPVTLCVDATRALTIGGDATEPVLGTLAWVFGLLLVFLPLSVARYRALE